MKALITCILAFSMISSVAQEHRCSRAHGSHFLVQDLMRSNSKRAVAEASRSDSLDILHTELFLDFTAWSAQELSARAIIDMEVLIDDLQEILLDLEGLTVDSVFIDDAETVFAHSGQTLTISPEAALNSGDTPRVRIHYHGSPITDESGWGGFYWQSDIAYNLGVGFYADPHSYGRVWHPCFDNFVERSPYTIEVLSSDEHNAYCGGLLTAVEPIGSDSLLTRWELSEHIPSYLASVAVGELTHHESMFISSTGDEIPVWLASSPGQNVAMVEAFDNLNTCLEGFEADFGPYRWPRVGYVAVPFNAGAMEHATNIAFPASGLGLDYLMAHEIAHMWWGDLVTCSSEEDMWLNEGMASFCEALFFEQLEGPDAYNTYVLDNLKDVLYNAASDDGGHYAVHGIGHDDTYGAHVYEKGADVAHNLRVYMGDDFFEHMAAFLEEQAFSDISSEELRDYLDPLTDANLQSFFDDWVFNPGYPDIRLHNFTNSAQSNGWSTDIELRQFLHYAPEYYTNVPLTLTLLSGAPGEATHTVETLVSGHQHFLTVDGLAFEPQHIIINRDQWLHQAVLAEERYIDTGTEMFNFAELRITANDFPGEDSVWVRVEHHLTAADDAVGQPEWRFSTDRFWRVITRDTENWDAELRLTYRGNQNNNVYLDSLFFTEMQFVGYPEDSLRMVWRPAPSAPWQVIEGSEFNYTGLTNDYQGLIDVPFQGSGDYAWAYPSDGTRLAEYVAHPSLVYPNPARDLLQTHLEANLPFQIADASGRTVLEGVTGNPIDIRLLSRGVYFFRAKARDVNISFIKE